MAIKIEPWDTAEILTDEEAIRAYLEEVFSEGDPALIATAIGNVLRARNIAAIARETHLSRDTIYSAFSSNGNPTLSTLLAVTKALGFQLTLKPVAPSLE